MQYKYESIIGDIYISASENYLLSVDFQAQGNSIFGKNEIIKETIKQLNEYFSFKRKIFDLPLNPEGTDFQKKVWSILQTIPYGETRSYKEIAISIGKSKAYRAIGNANNKNPIKIIIPCHRVIGTNNKLIGYAGGINIKQKLINTEKLFIN